VTRKVDPNIEGKPGKSSAKLFAAFRLADTEVELGMTPAEEKYDRVSELEGQSIDQIEAAFQTLARVKTAGLSKQAAPPEQQRLVYRVFSRGQLPQLWNLPLLTTEFSMQRCSVDKTQHR
jgi:hypothetical protein